MSHIFVKIGLLVVDDSSLWFILRGAFVGLGKKSILSGLSRSLLTACDRCIMLALLDIYFIGD
jgi:hypothetical protein